MAVEWWTHTLLKPSLAASRHLTDRSDRLSVFWPRRKQSQTTCKTVHTTTRTAINSETMQQTKINDRRSERITVLKLKLYFIRSIHILWGNSPCLEKEIMQKWFQEDKERKTSKNLDEQHCQLAIIINEGCDMTHSSAYILETGLWRDQPSERRWLKARQCTWWC